MTARQDLAFQDTPTCYNEATTTRRRDNSTTLAICWSGRRRPKLAQYARCWNWRAQALARRSFCRRCRGGDHGAARPGGQSAGFPCAHRVIEGCFGAARQKRPLGGAGSRRSTGRLLSGRP